MSEVVFLLEEESAKVLIEGLWPRLVPPNIEVRPRYVVFEGKQDLERQLARKVRGYLNPASRFIVLRDQDNAPNWQSIKARLTDLCRSGGRPEAIIRIACRELEAFYLGDLSAVETGLGVPGLGAQQFKAKYRDPDHFGSPSRELAALTRNRYQKVSGSRAIAPHLNLDRPRSCSFRQLLEAIKRAVSPIARGA